MISRENFLAQLYYIEMTLRALKIDEPRSAMQLIELVPFGIVFKSHREKNDLILSDYILKEILKCDFMDERYNEYLMDKKDNE